jgi:hypothetical protein
MPRVKRLFKPGVDDPQAVFNYGRACGADEERERIIALLEELLERTDNGEAYDDTNLGECLGIGSSIRLIKEENNV